MKPTWLFGSVRYRTTMGTKYLEKAAGKFGRLSCKNMAILGTCSISSDRTVGSKHTHHSVNLKNQIKTRQLKEKNDKKIHLPPSSDILAIVSMTLIKSFSLSLNSRSTSSRPRATICLESNSSKLVVCLPIPTKVKFAKHNMQL